GRAAGVDHLIRLLERQLRPVLAAVAAKEAGRTAADLRVQGDEAPAGAAIREPLRDETSPQVAGGGPPVPRLPGLSAVRADVETGPARLDGDAGIDDVAAGRYHAKRRRKPRRRPGVAAVARLEDAGLERRREGFREDPDVPRIPGIDGHVFAAGAIERQGRTGQGHPVGAGVVAAGQTLRGVVGHGVQRVRSRRRQAAGHESVLAESAAHAPGLPVVGAHLETLLVEGDELGAERMRKDAVQAGEMGHPGARLERGAAVPGHRDARAPGTTVVIDAKERRGPAWIDQELEDQRDALIRRSREAARPGLAGVAAAPEL